MPTPTIHDDGLGDARTKRTAKAKATEEYVSGGSNLHLHAYLRTLPRYIDDVTQDFGDDLYDRMLFDAQVESDVETLKMAVLGSGLSLMPAKKEGEEGYEQAEEIAAFCGRNLDRLNRPFVSEILHDMLDALAYGNVVAEQVYEVPKTGEDAGKLCLKAIKPKHRRTVAFVVDAYMNVVALMAIQPGKNYTITQSAFMGTDPSKIPHLLPRKKFAILSFKPKKADPRGSSILRTAYHAWWMKMQIWGEYLKWLSQFGTPSLIGTTAPEALPTVLTDALGNPIPDDEGNIQTVTPEAALVSIMQAFRNGSCIGLPHGADVKTLEPLHTGDAFTRAFDMLNREISKAITGQTLATMEGEHQARAAADTHGDILGSVVLFLKLLVELMVYEDIFKPLVEYNYGAEALALTPYPSFSSTEIQDFAEYATAIANLEKSGFLTPEQKPSIDVKLGLEKRSKEAVEEETERKRSMAQPPDPDDKPLDPPEKKDRKKPKPGKPRAWLGIRIRS